MGVHIQQQRFWLHSLGNTVSKWNPIKWTGPAAATCTAHSRVALQQAFKGRMRQWEGDVSPVKSPLMSDHHKSSLLREAAMTAGNVNKQIEDELDGPAPSIHLICDVTM